MQEIKNKIEAVLFITGRFMTADEIAQFSNIASAGTVKQAIKGLIKEYSTSPGALEIIQEDGQYKLNIKKQYNHLSTSLASGAELDAPSQATLAIIAYKQPALQSEIIKMRGNTAYDHIKNLKEQEFITSEKKGRTRLLKLAPKFFDYFDVVQDTLDNQFKKIAEKQEQVLQEKQEKINDEVEDNSKAPIYNELIIKKPVIEGTEIVEEKDKPTKRIVVEVRTVDNKSEEVISVEDKKESEIERTKEKELQNLDADDFGS
jgi:segregation and condensation protein B